jgi:hypothetical protein
MSPASATSVTTVLATILMCCASSPPVPTPQPVVPGTREEGVTNLQPVDDSHVIDRIASARCERSKTCDHIGNGAPYRDWDDCMNQMRTLVSAKINEVRCPGGIGEVGLSRCVHSLHVGECDSPGQVYPTVSHCKIDEMCLK